MKLIFLTLAVAAGLLAQPVVAPTNATLGTVRGENFENYNITNTFEAGYRFRSVGGDLGKYRSDVNFGNGLRLLSGSLTVNSRDGHGKYFDELLLNTQGLGNDPYEYSSLRIRKNRLYQYDFIWRQNDYYNPALPLASGQHLEDTVRTMSDHSLTLLPSSPFRVFLGYSRVNQNGPALSTANVLGTRGDSFPLFTDVRRLQNEYRLGLEARLFGIRLSLLRVWENFRDDTRRTSGAQAGNNPDDSVALQLLRRDEPYHGSTPSWRANLLYDQSKLLNVNGRFTYSAGRRDFIFDQTTLGTDRFGGALNNQVLVFGSAGRPVTTASLTTSLFPSERLTIANHTAFYNTRIDGNGAYSELDNATLSFAMVEFQYLGIRTFTNSTDASYRLTKTASLFGGYQYSTRRILSVEQTTVFNSPEREQVEQTNHLHTGRVGFRLQPLKPVTVIVNAEIGRADRPVYPTSEKNYQAIGGRVQYKAGNLLLSAQVRTNYNTNSASLYAYSSRSRMWSGDATWNARPWLSFDANYSKLHLNTLSGIAYFYNSALTNDYSTYTSNIHSGYFGARVSVGTRVELTAGYSRIQDTGDGRAPGPAAPYIAGLTQPAIQPGTLGYQTYPLTFESPLGRVSIKVYNRVRWNAGYQHYRYNEQLLPFQNYRAHTGYTSLSWMF